MSTQVFSVQHVRCSPPGPSCNYVMFYVLQDLRPDRSCGWRLSFQLNTHTADQRQHVFLHDVWDGHDAGPCRVGPRLRLACSATSRWQFQPTTRTSVRMGWGRHMILPQLGIFSSINQQSTRCVVCLRIIVQVPTAHDVNWYVRKFDKLLRLQSLHELLAHVSGYPNNVDDGSSWLCTG